VQQENLQQFELIQAEQQVTQAWMQQMFDQVITNQRHYGGTVYSLLVRDNIQEQQWRDLQHQQALVDAAADANAGWCSRESITKSSRFIQHQQEALADAAVDANAGAEERAPPRAAGTGAAGPPARARQQDQDVFKSCGRSTSLASATTSLQRISGQWIETTGTMAKSKNTTTEARFGSYKVTCWMRGAQSKRW
jgi:hypothetical protein